MVEETETSAMAVGIRQHHYSRFFTKYRWFVVVIGIVLLLQVFLGLRLILFHGTWDESVEGKGPRLFKWMGSSRADSESVTGNPDVLSEKGNRIKSTSPAYLDLDALTFVPTCNITSKESVSAIQRAKTQSCKEQLAKTACKIVDDSLYEKSLPRFCTNNVTTYGNYLGCFKDDKNNRIFPDMVTMLKDSNSPKNCVDVCLQSGFQYAGVQYGVECFCGNTEPSPFLKYDSLYNHCSMDCPFISDQGLKDDIFIVEDEDWKTMKCGGYFAMNIFETGVFQGYDGKGGIVNLDGYNNNEGDREDSVRIVFFLTLNGRALRQVYRLIKALFHERHYFYIHVDARQDYLYRELLSLGRKLPENVRFMTSRRGTIWGGASLLTVLVNGMRDLTFHSQEWKWKWDYVINLSESDFPLKSINKLEYFLTVNKGRNFLKSHGRDVQKFIQKQGLDKTFDECEYRMWRLGDRKLPTGILMDGGSDWVGLHKEFVHYVVNSEDELVAGLKTIFKHTLLPAESFFHILLRNSELCSTFMDNNLHVTNWKRKLGCKCQYRNIVDWCGCSPNDFRMSDWARLQLTEPRLLFFGRKFESIVNQGIVNNLETWLNPGRAESHFSTQDKFWLGIFHYHDLSPRPDDAVVTLGRSLSRIAANFFTTKYVPHILNNDHRVDLDNYKENPERSHKRDVELIEMTVYNQNDLLQGILVKFKVTLTDEITGDLDSVNMETWFKQEAFYDVNASSMKASKYLTKLQNPRVGTDYDQKEQIFRNYAGAIGPFSEPTLAYTVLNNEPFNISVVWIDPTKAVLCASNVSVLDGTMANFVKPVLKSPLRPGNWTVKILTIKQDLLYEVTFLVLPLEVYQGRTVSETENRIINHVSPGIRNSTLTIEQRIDNLVSKYYKFQDFCFEKEVNHVTLSRWSFRAFDNPKRYGIKSSDFERQKNSLEILDASLCSHVQWSSLYPDPKSTILGIDPKTGLLVP